MMICNPRKRGLSDAFGSPGAKQLRVGASCSPHKIAFLDLADHSARLCRACKQRPGEHLFTSEDVQKIVERAVAKREGELRQEYDAILQQRQAENFSNFRRFHEDYVSRQLNQSDYSYMS